MTETTEMIEIGLGIAIHEAVIPFGLVCVIWYLYVLESWDSVGKHLTDLLES